jgi:hypothetical protein
VIEHRGESGMSRDSIEPRGMNQSSYQHEEEIEPPQNAAMNQSYYQHEEIDHEEEVEPPSKPIAHRDSFAESESEPNLHYQTESLKNGEKEQGE